MYPNSAFPGLLEHGGGLHARAERFGSSGYRPQRDALLAGGLDERHLFEDKASGARLDRSGLAVALNFVRARNCLAVCDLEPFWK